MNSLIRFAINQSAKLQPIAESVQNVFRNARGQSKPLAQTVEQIAAQKAAQKLANQVISAEWKTRGIGGAIQHTPEKIIEKGKTETTRALIAETRQHGWINGMNQIKINRHIENLEPQLKNNLRIQKFFTKAIQKITQKKNSPINNKRAQDWAETHIKNFERQFGNISPSERSRLSGQFVRHYKNPNWQTQKMIIDNLKRLHKSVYAYLSDYDEKQLKKLAQGIKNEKHTLHTDVMSYRKSRIHDYMNMNSSTYINKSKTMDKINHLIENNQYVTEQEIKPIIDTLIQDQAVKPQSWLVNGITDEINMSKMTNGTSNAFGVIYLETKKENLNRLDTTIIHELLHQGWSTNPDQQLTQIGNVDDHLMNQFSVNLMELLNERLTRTLSKTEHFYTKSIEATVKSKKGRLLANTTASYLGYQDLQSLITKFNHFLQDQNKLQSFNRWYLEFKTLGKEPPQEFYTLLKAFQSQHKILQ